MMAQGWVTPGTRRTGLDIMLNFPSVHFIMVHLEIVYHVPSNHDPYKHLPKASLVIYFIISQWILSADTLLCSPVLSPVEYPCPDQTQVTMDDQITSL